MGSDGEERVTLRSLAPSVFIPTMVYEVGNGAVAPILALTALRLGASASVAGLIVGLLGLGRLAGNVPSAMLVNRLGNRRAMIAVAAVAAVAMLVVYFATHLVVLAAAVLLVGACNATFWLARHSYVTLVVPPSVRAAVLSTLGGSHRVGLFAGPFLGAAMIHATDLRGAYLVAVAAAAATALLLLLAAEPPHAAAFAQRSRETMSITALWREHGRLLLTLGLAVLAIGAVRAGRSTVLPLWADRVGLDAQTTSVIFGVGAAVDMALFYPAGRVMDQYGRLSAALPAMLLLGGAMMLIPLTNGAVGLAVVAIAMSVGNGLGSGIVMTLGADAAPSDAPVRFLSQWRLMGDSGNAAGPLLVSAVTTAWSLAAAIVSVGAVGLLAAAGVARWAPRYSSFATAAMVRARQS